jgi:hypothetical protein
VSGLVLRPMRKRENWLSPAPTRPDWFVLMKISRECVRTLIYIRL